MTETAKTERAMVETGLAHWTCLASIIAKFAFAPVGPINPYGNF